MNSGIIHDLHVDAQSEITLSMPHAGLRTATETKISTPITHYLVRKKKFHWKETRNVYIPCYNLNAHSCK